MITAIERELALHDELHTAVKLIKIGIKEIRNIDGGNDFYHPLIGLGSNLQNSFDNMMKTNIIHIDGKAIKDRIQWCFLSHNIERKS